MSRHFLFSEISAATRNRFKMKRDQQKSSRLPDSRCFDLLSYEALRQTMKGDSGTEGFCMGF